MTSSVVVVEVVVMDGVIMTVKESPEVVIVWVTVT